MPRKENSWTNCCSCPCHDVIPREVCDNNHAVEDNDEENDGEVMVVVEDGHNDEVKGSGGDDDVVGEGVDVLHTKDGCLLHVVGADKKEPDCHVHPTKSLPLKSNHSSQQFQCLKNDLW